MAVSLIQLSWTVVWFLLSWQLRSTVALPEVGDTPETFHAADNNGVYINDNTKMWNFTTSEGSKLLLSFLDINLEQIFDFITVGNGTTGSPGTEVLRWSGKQQDDKLVYLSFDNEMWVTLREDNSVQSNGFYAQVKKVPEDHELTCPKRYRCGNQVCLTRHDICDGFPNCVTGVDESCLEDVSVTGSYRLEINNTGIQIGANHGYTWVFITDSDSRLQLTFDFISTEENYDFVTVGEGSDVSANRLLTWSGHNDANLPIIVTSSNFSMWLTIATDNTKHLIQFSANLLQVKDPQDITCDSGTFDCMNGVCLPNEYVCDNIIHCDNGRDESDCQSSCPLSMRCRDGSCFQPAEKCNGNIFCLDEVDESGCTVMEMLDDSRTFYKEHFINHIRTIEFTTTNAKLLLTIYLPQRLPRRTEVSVETSGGGPSLNEVFYGTQAAGFISILTGSDMKLKFSTNNKIAISVTRQSNSYTQTCLNEVDCGNGLCIPYSLFCEGVQECQNQEAKTSICGGEVVGCFTKDPDECTMKDVNMTLTKIEMTNITTLNVPAVAERLFNVSNEVDLLSGDSIDAMATIMVEIVNLEQQAEVGVVTESVIGLINNMYDVSSEAIGESTSVGVFPEVLEAQLGNAVSSNSNFTEIMLPNVRAVAGPVDEENLNNGVSFGINFLGATSREEPTELRNFSPPSARAGVSSNENSSAYIELPGSIRGRVTTGVNSSVPISFVIYKNATIFPISSGLAINETTATRTAIASQVIGANAGETAVVDLPTDGRVLIKLFEFPVGNKCEKQHDPKCVFWKYDKQTQKGEWSTEGCEMSNKSEDNQVTCLCNHLTSFAVLVHLSKEDKPTVVVLDIITDIGCVLSITGLLICLVVIFGIKKLRDGQKFRVHANLCIALIAFYLTFLIGIDRTSNPVGCKIITFFIHFFSLSSMAWMSVEAILLYQLVYKLNQGDVKNLLPIGMAFAWGVPLIVAIVVAIFDQSHDYECFPDYCFLHPGFGMYVGFLLLIGLMFVFNTILFVIIDCKFSCRPIMSKDREKIRKEITARVRGTVLFWLLLGMSWVFGFLAAFPTGPFKIIFDIIFTVLMALQGFAMFYLLAFNNPEVKKLLNRLNCCGDDIFSSRSRSTSKTTQGSKKSGSNDETDKPTSSETDTVRSSSDL